MFLLGNFTTTTLERIERVEMRCALTALIAAGVSIVYGRL